MADYIEREALLKAARQDKAIGLCQADIVDVQDLINSQPAADVVEVVRCKDCIHWSVDCGTDETVCLKIYSDGAASAYAWQERKADDFCSYGERRNTDGKET